MDNQLARLHLRRILAGEVHCFVGHDRIVVPPPTATLISEAEAFANDVIYESKFTSPTEEEIISRIIKEGLWSDENENRLQSIPPMMESIRVEAWQSHLKFASRRVEKCRKQILRLTDEWFKLYAKRHAYDVFTCSGLNVLARNDFILSVQVQEYFELGPTSQKRLLNQYYANQLDDHDLRELAKSSNTKALWNVGRDGHMIASPVSDWTDEQIGLISWLKLYDNIQENIDCPPDNIVHDDLLLDGWLITQNRQREKDKNERLGGGIKSGKHGGKAGIQEVYVPAETPEDAQRINEMNDAQTRFQKRQREKLIATHGVVDETQMPDSQLLMRQQALQEFMDKAKGKNRRR